MENREKFQCVILAYNHGEFIEQCINSVQKATKDQAEIFVLDDGSTDRTLEVLTDLARNQPHIQVQSQKNTGDVLQNTLKLLERANSDFVLLMSGDDYLDSQFRTERPTRIIHQNSDVRLVLPRGIDAKSKKPIMPKKLESILESGNLNKLFTQHLYRQVSRIHLQGAVIDRRAAIETINSMKTQILDDYPFIFQFLIWLKNSKKEFRYTSENVWRYRRHSGNLHSKALRQFSLVINTATNLVPAKKLKSFKWDMIVFQSVSELKEARSLAAQQLSENRTIKRLMWPIEISSIVAATRSREKVAHEFLTHYIQDKEAGIFFRLLAKAAVKIRRG